MKKDVADIERFKRGDLPLEALFREADWDEALDLAAGGLAKIRDSAPAGRRLGAGRFRLGQGQQRRGLPVPEARAHGHAQRPCRPLHAAVPREFGGGAARRHRLGLGQQPGGGRGRGRADLPDRRQSDGQPSGRCDLDQERGRSRRQAGDLRSASHARSRGARPGTCSSAPTPMWR